MKMVTLARELHPLTVKILRFWHNILKLLKLVLIINVEIYAGNVKAVNRQIQHIQIANGKVQENVPEKHTHLLMLKAEIGQCILIMSRYFWLIQTVLKDLINSAKTDFLLQWLPAVKKGIYLQMLYRIV